jgi:hypothetical protein
MFIRVIHAQAQLGDLLINDIEDGRPVHAFDDHPRQDVYVNYYKKSFDGFGLSEDKTLPGFVDLVPTDNVLLSRNQGVLKGLEDAGLVTIIDLPVGATNSPVITSATQDRVGGSSGTDDDQLVITGTGFLSNDPHVSKVFLTNDAGLTNEIDYDLMIALGNTFTDTLIVVDFGSATIIESVGVESRGERVDFAVTAI